MTDCASCPRSKPQKVVDKPSWHAPHQTGLFPVSIEWEPPFTMLVDLIGHGDHQVVTSCMENGLILFYPAQRLSLDYLYFCM